MRHSGGEEPLLGIYDKQTEPVIRKMILDGIYAVRKAERYIYVRRMDYVGREEFLCNCNTPEDFETAKQFLEEYCYEYNGKL